MAQGFTIALNLNGKITKSIFPIKSVLNANFAKLQLLLLTPASNLHQPFSYLGVYISLSLSQSDQDSVFHGPGIATAMAYYTGAVNSE